jgi:hypothetical protein
MSCIDYLINVGYQALHERKSFEPSRKRSSEIDLVEDVCQIAKWAGRR